MRAATALALITVVILVAGWPAAGDAWSSWNGRVFIGVGPGWWGPPYPYGWYPPYVYPPPAPTVIVESPPVYVERPDPPVDSGPAVAAPAGSWYYCPSAGGYYPYVQTCAEAWVPVPARPQ